MNVVDASVFCLRKPIGNDLDSVICELESNALELLVVDTNVSFRFSSDSMHLSKLLNNVPRYAIGVAFAVEFIEFVVFSLLSIDSFD